MQTGMARKMDGLGRVVIPAEMRRAMDIKAGDEVIIGFEDGAVILRAADAACVFCGGSRDVGDFRGRGVCADCRAQLGG